MENINETSIAVIDDNDNDIVRTVENIKATDINATIVTFSSVKSFALSSRNYTLAIVDIDLKDGDGITLAHEISQKTSFIVYMTALHERIRDAFGYKVIGFIDKSNENADIVQQCSKIFGEYISSLITLNTVYGEKRIRQSEIIYFSVEKRTIQVYLSSGKRVQLRNMSLKECRNQLDQSFFCDVNKSEILNINYLSAMEDYKLTLVDATVLYMSRRARKNIEEAWLKKFI